LRPGAAEPPGGDFRGGVSSEALGRELIRNWKIAARGREASRRGRKDCGPRPRSLSAGPGKIAAGGRGLRIGKDGEKPKKMPPKQELSYQRGLRRTGKIAAAFVSRRPKPALIGIFKNTHHENPRREASSSIRPPAAIFPALPGGSAAPGRNLHNRSPPTKIPAGRHRDP